MLRPSRPMMRPFISSEGMGTTRPVISAVWSTITRWMAVTTTSRALLLGVLARRALDGAREADRVVLGLLADLLEERRLGLVDGSSR